MFKIGKVEKIWDLTGIDHELDWKRKPFNDPIQVEEWIDMGFPGENFNGNLVDSSEPGNLPSWVWKVAYDNFPMYDNVGISLFMMTPGDMIPEHKDTYQRYIEVFEVENTNKIWRTLVMLEDWKSGHYLEIDRVPLVDWNAGDTFSWPFDSPHMAANLGRENRYTLQITGTRNDL